MVSDDGSGILDGSDGLAVENPLAQSRGNRDVVVLDRARAMVHPGFPALSKKLVVVTDVGVLRLRRQGQVEARVLAADRRGLLGVAAPVVPDVERLVQDPPREAPLVPLVVVRSIFGGGIVGDVADCGIPKIGDHEPGGGHVIHEHVLGVVAGRQIGGVGHLAALVDKHAPILPLGPELAAGREGSLAVAEVAGQLALGSREALPVRVPECGRREHVSAGKGIAVVASLVLQHRLEVAVEHDADPGIRRDRRQLGRQPVGDLDQPYRGIGARSENDRLRVREAVEVGTEGERSTGGRGEIVEQRQPVVHAIVVDVGGLCATGVDLDVIQAAPHRTALELDPVEGREAIADPVLVQDAASTLLVRRRWKVRVRDGERSAMLALHVGVGVFPLA